MRKVLALFFLLLLAAPAAAAPRVITSIVPIHAIVAAVMEGQGEPELLFQGTLSEHATGLSPQQILALGQADAVFFAAPQVEVKLAQLNGAEAVNGKVFTALAEAPGVSHLALREGGAWEQDSDEAHTGETYNGHVWLDPENAKAMAQAIAATLGSVDPEHATSYATNATTFAAKIDGLEAELATLLAPVRDKPFIVFHDAYPYFEKRFGLRAVGSISDASAAAPSAKRIGEIQAKIAETGAICVFREPQFDSRFADTVIEGSAARAGILDAVGSGLSPGPEAYPELLRALANSLKTCLAGN